ncbi:MAG: hypothetical protein JJU45_00370 [Acidimicrobiia bacterium]|nr:hypothetical protein [Acidimicrobiia bacterium]
MLHYVAIAGPAAAVTASRGRMAPALRATRFVDGDVEEFVGASGRWAVAAITANDQLSSDRLVVDEDAFVAFNGPALAADGGQDHLGPTALASYREHGVEGLTRTVVGTHNIVAFSPRHGLGAATDFSGMVPLYWATSGNLLIVGNRPSTIAEVAGGRQWDLLAMSWLVGHSNVFGDRTVHDGVQFLRPDLVLTAAPGSSEARLDSSPVNIWPGPSEGGGVDDLDPAEWDRVADAMVDGVRSLKSLEVPLLLLLTGGKDSRLCLALAMAAGITDRISLVTMGTETNPEVHAAAEVARAAGLPHFRSGSGLLRPRAVYLPAGVDEDAVRPPPPPRARRRLPDAGPPKTRPWFEDMDEVWRRLRASAYRSDGMTCLWDNLTTASHGPLTVSIKGYGGEFYRTHQYSRGGLATPRALAKRFVRFHHPPDPLHLLRPEVAEAQATWLRSWVEMARSSVRFDLLPDHFRISYRNGHWNGPNLQFKPTHIQLNPLLAMVGAQASMRLAPDARAMERFHYEVMRRAAPELLDVPFLDDEWDPRVRQRGDGVQAPTVPPPPDDALASAFFAPSGLEWPAQRSERSEELALPEGASPLDEPSDTVHRTKQWQWRFLGSQQDEMRALFRRAASDTGLGEICDVDRLDAVAERAGSIRANVDAKTLISAVGISLSLLGEVEPVSDRPF